jgi:hypothetical protein
MFAVLGLKVMTGDLFAKFSDCGEVLSDALSLLVLDTMANSNVLGTEHLKFLSVLWHTVGSIINDMSDSFETMIKTENGVAEELFLVSHSLGILVNNVLVEIHLKCVSEHCEVTNHICGLFKL